MCDNITSVTVINTDKSRDTFLQCCLRELCYIAAIYEFEIRAVHLAGTENRLPDYLSRWHTSDKFAALFYNAVSELELIQLKEDVRVSTRAAYALGSKKNLLVQWRAFLLFCTYFNMSFIPANLDTICCYAQFLSRSFKSVESIKNYINDVKVMHLMLDCTFPHLDSFVYKLLIKGLSRTKLHMPRRALPISPDILLEMVKHLNLESSSDCVYWCLFLFAFFLMSRKSNLVPDSSSQFDKNQQLTRGKVFVVNDIAIVVFEWTKTIQHGERRLKIPLVKIPGSVLCPVSAYNRMCSKIPASNDSPAFVMSKKSRLVPVTYAQFQNKLKSVIQKTGRDPNSYSSHSFRRGGATFAFSSHVPSDLIQLHGDWASDAYKIYLEFSMKDKISVVRNMANFV
ncbi:unnamed protein product [Mytilus coruscus]|uniref:Tyr recombinase domain-containing protein n=1 Tax=Mytilus coruscus TaxID=42192 RepID=A0A6J8C6K2_MYTCO|nr:unnamed protein product [Mytilus coruscus]